MLLMLKLRYAIIKEYRIVRLKSINEWQSSQICEWKIRPDELDQVTDLIPEMVDGDTAAD